MSLSTAPRGPLTGLTPAVPRPAASPASHASATYCLSALFEPDEPCVTTPVSVSPRPAPSSRPLVTLETCFAHFSLLIRPGVIKMIFALGIASCSELRTAAMFSLNSSFGTPPGEAETWSFEPRHTVMAKTSCRLIEPRISLSDARSSLWGGGSAVGARHVGAHATTPHSQ